MFGRFLFHLFIKYAPVIDMLVNVSVFYFSSIIIKSNFILNSKSVESNINILVLAFIYSFLWMINSNSQGYYRFKRVRQLLDEFFIILPLTFKTYLELIAVYILLGGVLWNDYSFFHRRFFAYSFFMQLVVFLYYQFIVIRIYSLLHKKGYNIKLVMIAGINENSIKSAEKIGRNPFWGYKVAGFIDDDPSRAEKFGVLDLYAGPSGQIEKLYFDKSFERLICCYPASQYAETTEAIRICEKNNIDVHIVPDMFYYMTANSAITTLEGIPLISLYEPALSGWGGSAKRLMDLIFSLFGIILISPLLIAIASLVKFSSRGPVFYSQERVGLDNVTFMMYKFRTMYTDSETGSGPKWADKNDPRCTRIGAFLRKTSLDELPQLFNVLRGEMSLVGPRPERPFFVHKFKEEIRNYMKRHRVKAGITGWAQVNGLRGSSTSLAQRIEYDLYYIENWSIWFDLKILVKTILVVWNDKNAY